MIRGVRRWMFPHGFGIPVEQGKNSYVPDKKTYLDLNNVKSVEMKSNDMFVLYTHTNEKIVIAIDKNVSYDNYVVLTKRLYNFYLLLRNNTETEFKT